ncbi:hypothetical protein [Leptospira yasudae]|uniref:hypothetical protein n=1 Tax=Leptospira yasudae TaxID=2202201 RepID=UPI001F4EC4AA|nr:hypothetical protein [Leptospira yasudae]
MKLRPLLFCFTSVLLCSFFFVSCFAEPLLIPENKIVKPTSVNSITYPVYAKECGFVLLLVIPIGINDRFVRAYAKISAQAKDGFLSEITLQESWFYGLIGTGYCTTMTGMVTKEVVDEKK